LDNGVEPGGALQTDKELSEPQIKGLRAELDEHHPGVRNRRRLLLLERGMAWNRIGASFNEMEFSELKKMSRADSCAGFCVPGPVLNYFEDSNYAHASAAQESFWLNTILPRAARLVEEWQLAVMSRYQADRSLAMDKSRSVKINRKKCCTHGFIHASRAAKNSSLRFYAWFDSSEIHAVQLAALAVTDQAAKWWGMGTPLNNLYSAFNVPFPEVPYGNTGYRPIGLEAYGTDTMDTIDHPPVTPGPPDPFNINDPITTSKMRARTVNLTNLNKTVSKRVARVMADALDNGRSYGETVEALKKEFNFTRTRAATIARTEIGASVEEARSEERNQAGVPMKSWLASRKETGRPQHLATESETAASPIQNDAPFTIAGSGVTCQHPRASNLPAGQSVNCGCTTWARYPGDNLKAVLGRYSRGFLTYDPLTARNGSRLQSKDAPDDNR